MKNYNNGLISYGGFPRSGNHTLGRVVSLAFPQRQIRWLVHRVSEIATAPNCVITIRNPLHAVGSWIEFRNDLEDDNADRYLEWFIRYFRQLNRCADQIVILDLDDLMCLPYDCAKAVSIRFDLEPSTLIRREEVEEWLLFNTPMHLPNPTSPNKQKWFDRIQSSRFYGEAHDLFVEVLGKKTKINHDV